MYHHIAAPPPRAGAIRRDLSVTPVAFEAQLRYLVRAGYHPILLRDLIAHLNLGAPLPSKPIILTFDDGYKDQYTNAYPLLKRYGFVGTFFIVTGFIGQQEYLSWEEIEVMSAEGMEMEAHGHTHPDLRGRPTSYIVWQVLGAKEALEARTGQPVRFFSYPSGKYDQRVMRVLHSAHYWGAVTVRQGTRQSSLRPFELQRIRVRGKDTLADFVRNLNLWLSD